MVTYALQHASSFDSIFKPWHHYKCIIFKFSHHYAMQQYSLQIGKVPPSSSKIFCRCKQCQLRYPSWLFYVLAYYIIALMSIIPTAFVCISIPKYSQERYLWKREVFMP